MFSCFHVFPWFCIYVMACLFVSCFMCGEQKIAHLIMCIILIWIACFWWHDECLRTWLVFDDMMNDGMMNVFVLILQYDMIVLFTGLCGILTCSIACLLIWYIPGIIAYLLFWCDIDIKFAHLLICSPPPPAPPFFLFCGAHTMMVHTVRYVHGRIFLSTQGNKKYFVAKIWIKVGEVFYFLFYKSTFFAAYTHRHRLERGLTGSRGWCATTI